MSTTPKFPTHAEQLLTALAVFSEHPKGPLCTFDLDADDCLALVSHIRTQANTLASTQAELELCRKAHGEQAERVKELEALVKEASDECVLQCQALLQKERDLTASESAHLATRRALEVLRKGADKAHSALHTCVKERWDEAHVENAFFSLGRAIDESEAAEEEAARAEVAKADHIVDANKKVDEPREHVCGECSLFYSYCMCPRRPYVSPRGAICSDFQPRADAQKGATNEK